MFKAVATLNEKQTKVGKTLVTGALFAHFGKWNAGYPWYVDDAMGYCWDNNFKMWAHYNKSFWDAEADATAATIEPLTLDNEPYFQVKHEGMTHVFFCYGIWAGVFVDGKLVTKGYTTPFVVSLEKT